MRIERGEIPSPRSAGRRWREAPDEGLRRGGGLASSARQGAERPKISSHRERSEAATETLQTRRIPKSANRRARRRPSSGRFAAIFSPLCGEKGFAALVR